MPNQIMITEKFSLIYFDSYGDEHHANFTIHEYHSLMELLFDKYLEDWGDCKARAWCGTCQIAIIKGHVKEKIDQDERQTLSKRGGATATNRLACQIPLTAELDQIVFKIISNM